MGDNPFAVPFEGEKNLTRLGGCVVTGDELTRSKINAAVAAIVAAARKEERERCAKLCDYHAKGEEPGFGSFSRAASVIRALGDG